MSQRAHDWGQRLVLALGCFVLLGASAFAQAYKPGDKVIVIQDAKLMVSGDQVVRNVRRGTMLKVGDVNGQWLWIKGNEPGWLDERNVIPINRDTIARLTEMIRNDPNNGQLYLGRGCAWEELGELEIAFSDFSEVIRLNPEQAVGHYDRGNIFRYKRDYDKAIADYNEALRRDPKYVDAYYNRGLVWAAKKEFDKAIADDNETLRIDPKYALAYNDRGASWECKGHLDKALADYSEELRLHPKSHQAYINRARLKAKWPDAGYRDAQQAVADATKACELTNWKKPNYLNTLAAAFAEAGDFAKAVESQTKAIELLTSEKEKDDYRTRLSLYQAGKPYREAPKNSAVATAK